MPGAKPVFVGGNPSSEVPVSGGSLFGKMASMPQTMMNAPGGMFGGQGQPGSPTAPAPTAQPVNPALAKAQQGAASPYGMAPSQYSAQVGTGSGTGGGMDIMSLIRQLMMQQQGGV